MEQRQTEAYKRSFGDSMGAGIGALAGSGKRYYILEHRTSSKYHHAGESQKIILNQVEIGRDPRCQIRFDDSFTTVSRRHAAIIRDGNGWKLVNLSKVNQTFLNGQEVADQWYLENGDEIQLSSNGPRLGFIVPQGERSMIKNINFTERFSLFRQQVMKPYKQMMTLFCVLFVLLIGGIVAWGLYSDQKAEERNFALKAGLESANAQQQEIAAKQDELKNENERLLSTQSSTAASMSAALHQTNANTSQGFNTLRSEVVASNQQIQDRVTKIVEEQKAEAAAAALARARADSAQKAEQAAKEKENVIIPVTSSTPRPTSYSAYFPYIYYIQLDKIETVDSKGRISTYNTPKSRWAGTGFLLNNGRFVTSRRIIERWYYKTNDNLIDPLMQRLLKTEMNDKESIVAYFTAYSATGEALTFTSKQFTVDKSGDTYDNKKGVNYAPSMSDKDWAYFNIAKGGGLKFNTAKSTSLERGNELVILGFPGEIGINSASGPVFGSGVTANGGLDRGIILTTNTSFELGGSGAPAFIINGSGELEVIGLISTVSTGQRGNIVPISAIR
ncbi:hypothetical protein AGMMS49574_18980 [Bacteroidia bacterium]|nr:hypothetical protein AGMMS49574_18980 [Bacteroidia bacterium]